MICDDKVACRAIDEELERGMTGAALARLMTLRGFEVTAPTVLQHAKHRQPIAPPGVATRKRDLALLVRDKAYTMAENMPDELFADKGVQGALTVGLRAEALLDKREARTDDRKSVIQLAILLAGGPAGLLAPPELTSGDDDIIEGTAEEVDE